MIVHIDIQSLDTQKWDRVTETNGKMVLFVTYCARSQKKCVYKTIFAN